MTQVSSVFHSDSITNHPNPGGRGALYPEMCWLYRMLQTNSILSLLQTIVHSLKEDPFPLKLVGCIWSLRADLLWKQKYYTVGLHSPQLLGGHKKAVFTYLILPLKVASSCKTGPRTLSFLKQVLWHHQDQCRAHCPAIDVRTLRDSLLPEHRKVEQRAGCQGNWGQSM